MERRNYEEALGLIEKWDSIIIHRHLNPDGDAIASQKGLKEIIALNYPHKKVYMVGDSPSRYSFIAPEGMDEVEDSLFPSSLSILLDMSSPSLVSDERWKTAGDTLRFDHHLFIEKICRTEVIDSSRESCAGLVAEWALEMSLSLNREAASALFTGIVTDSGRFLYGNVSDVTFRVVSELVKYDFDRNSIFTNLYSEDFSALKRKAYYLEKIEIGRGGVAWTYNTSLDVKKMGGTAASISRGLVNSMANIKGVGIWVSFTEDDETGRILAELRSRSADINAVAVKYGGGGHRNASGASLSSKDEAMRMLSDLERIGEEENQQPTGQGPGYERKLYPC